MANKHFFYVIPLLSILSITPSQLLDKKPSRFPASVVESAEKVEETHPNLKSLVSKLDQKDMIVDEKVTIDTLRSDNYELTYKIQDKKINFNKDAKDKEEIKKQREAIELLISDSLIFDKEFSLLVEKKEIDGNDIVEFQVAQSGHKNDLEELLVMLIKNESAAEVSAPKTLLAEEKKEDDKKDDKVDNSKDKVAVKEDKKEDDKCLASEQVKVLTTQVEKLMDEQKLILQAMLNLTQAMANMTQNMQSNQPYFPIPQTAYQYNAPMTQGNWVYHPQGFNPSMNQGFYPNQTAAPQMQQPMQMPQQQMQGQNNWNMMPSQNFQFQQAPMQVGQFGMNSQAAPMTSFNFSSPSAIQPMGMI